MIRLPRLLVYWLRNDKISDCQRLLGSAMTTYLSFLIMFSTAAHLDGAACGIRITASSPAWPLKYETDAGRTLYFFPSATTFQICVFSSRNRVPTILSRSIGPICLNKKLPFDWIVSFKISPSTSFDFEALNFEGQCIVVRPNPPCSVRQKPPSTILSRD